MTTSPFRLFAIACLALPASALAQNFDAMIQQQMREMDQNIQRGNQQINQMVQQRMQDPQVRASYEQYVYQQRMRGQPAMDYPTYTYNYIYTQGFSAGGTAHARANEANISANERAKVQDLRNAEAQRGMAQQQQRDAYFQNQQEAGRGLMGQSTFYAPNGYATQLPHTWQRNTYQQHQGNTYYVDHGGQYFVRGTDGYWYPLTQR